MPKPIKEELERDEIDEYDDKVKEKFKQMRKVWHDERREKERVQRENQEAVNMLQRIMEENKKYRSLIETGSKEYATTLETAANLELEVAKRAYREAYEAGDAERVVEAQEALTAAKIKADKVNNFKPAPLQQEKPVVQTAPQPETTTTRVDPKASAWQEANPWFGVDEEMTALALTVHRKLVEGGVSPTSDEYYERINTRMRQVFPDAFPSEKPVKKSTVVAPATRSTAPKKIVLTKSQVNIAKRLGLTNEQYARAIAEQQRNQNG